MLACTVADEPSMEAILAEVRRILAEEEAARIAPAMENGHGNPLLLTNMIAADGSVVSIAPDTQAHLALRPMACARDPFADIEALKAQVSTLVGTGPDTGPAGCGGAAKRDPDSARLETSAAKVASGVLSQELVVPVGKPAGSAGAVSLRTPDRAPVRIGGAEHSVIPADAAAGGAAPDAHHPRDPAAEIECMLAHQLAAAHHAVMTLTSATVNQIRGGAGGGDDEPREAGSRSRARVRVLGKRHQSAAAARLADSTVRMMQAYNSTLATLMTLGGEATKSMAARKFAMRKGGKATPVKSPPGSAARSARGGKRTASRGHRRSKGESLTARAS